MRPTRRGSRLAGMAMAAMMLGCGAPQATSTAERYGVLQEKAPPVVTPTRLQACAWGCQINRRTYDMTCYRRCCRIFGSRYARFSLSLCAQEVSTGGGR